MKPWARVSGSGGLRRQGARRLSVVPVLLLVAGCASVLTFTPIGRDAPAADSAGACEEGRQLSPWGEIGGTLSVRGQPGAFDSGVLQIGQPADVAVSLDQLYVLDPLQGQLLVIEQGAQIARRRLSLTGLDPRARLAVSAAGLPYLADPATGDVRQLDLSGQVVRRFAAPAVLSDPVGVAVSATDGRLFVADGLTARVVVFNANGTVEQVLGAEPGGELQLRSTGDVAVAPDEVFLADPLGQQIHYLSGSGRYRYSFGADALREPVALALGDDNRVYVADRGDGTIKIFRGGELLGVVGGPDDPDRVRFGRIGGMATGGGLLYVTDLQTISIRVFRVVVPCS